MSFPEVTAKDWRAQVDKELAGTPFEKALVHRTAEGLAIQPLYTEGPAGAGLDIDPNLAPFGICLKVDPAARIETVNEELEAGADALWLDSASADVALAAPGIGRVFLVLECAGVSPQAQLDRLSTRLSPEGAFALGADPFADVARGLLAPSGLAGARDALVQAARTAEEKWPRATVVTVSTLPYHDAGADAADELGIALATGAAYLESLVEGGLSPAAAGRRVMFRLAAGRDTFGEMCKLRALRVVWRKVLLAADATPAPRPLVHAVCSSRTLAQRDPWVNMLRGTTQVFAAVLGGADLVTPTAFDEALGPASPLGRRVARNTGLVLREESALGKVKDAPGRLVLLRLPDGCPGARGVEALPGHRARGRHREGARRRAASREARIGLERVARPHRDPEGGRPRRLRVRQPRREAPPPGPEARGSAA